VRLTDGGMETVLIFDEGLELPSFAAFDLLRTAEGTAALRDYYEPFLAIAREHGLPFQLSAPTWRASPDWAEEIGYTLDELAAANRRAVTLMHEIRAANPDLEITIEAQIGPRGDGYVAEHLMTAAEAEGYHAVQIASLYGIDVATALTMTYAEEAIGIVRAARKAGLQAAVSFTVETDGRLPSGQPLGEAIQQVDPEGAAYFMVNCAHPEHFEHALEGEWVHRIKGLRANASRKSHAELDESETLDSGDPEELGAQYAALKRRLPELELLGGCCGTDHRHIAAIAAAWRD
jgi:S-methylmethionine-dependent homocysteine/selenocysteine methylase